MLTKYNNNKKQRPGSKQNELPEWEIPGMPGHTSSLPALPIHLPNHCWSSGEGTLHSPSQTSPSGLLLGPFFVTVVTFYCLWIICHIFSISIKCPDLSQDHLPWGFYESRLFALWLKSAVLSICACTSPFTWIIHPRGGRTRLFFNMQRVCAVRRARLQSSLISVQYPPVGPESQRIFPGKKDSGFTAEDEQALAIK